MTLTPSFTRRQSGKFLVGWLFGVAFGTAIIGIGLYFGFNYLSTTDNQLSQQTEQRPAASGQTSRTPMHASVVDQSPTMMDATESARSSGDGLQRPRLVQSQPQASAAPASPAFVQTRNGEVIPVGEGETIDSVLDQRARDQNLNAGIERAVRAVDRATDNATRQQQQRVADARVQDQQQRQQYEQQLRQREAQRRDLMLQEDARRGLNNVEPDPDEEDEIAPRIPD